MQQHLSTIDGVILSTMFVEDFLFKNYKNIIIENLFMDSFKVKAGCTPIENLNDILIKIKKLTISNNSYSFIVDISNMRIELHFKEIENISIDKRLDNESKNYYSYHLKNVKHDIQNIKYPNNNEICCEVLREKSGNTIFSGIGSGFSNSISLVECLVFFSQMGQLLAYNYDLINREDSETLWMKQVKAKIDIPYKYSGPILATGKIVNCKLLKLGTDYWRTFEMDGGTADDYIHFSGKIAHKLPQARKELILNEQK